MKDEYQLANTGLTFGKIVYWFINATFAFYLVKKVNVFLKLKLINTRSIIFFKLLFNCLFLFIVTSLLVGVLVSAPGGFLGAWVRIFHLILGLGLLILVSFTTTNNLFISAYCLFLFIDQIRVITEALFPVELIQ